MDGDHCWRDHCDHCWGLLMWTIDGIHDWESLLGIFAEDHLWRSLMGSLLGVIDGDHCWCHHCCEHQCCGEQCVDHCWSWLTGLLGWPAWLAVGAKLAGLGDGWLAKLIWLGRLGLLACLNWLAGLARRAAGQPAGGLGRVACLSWLAGWAGLLGCWLACWLAWLAGHR